MPTNDTNLQLQQQAAHSRNASVKIVMLYREMRIDALYRTQRCFSIIVHPLYEAYTKYINTPNKHKSRTNQTDVLTLLFVQTQSTMYIQFIM